MTLNSIPRNILRLQGSLHPRRPTDSYPTESGRLRHYVPPKSQDPIAQRRRASPEEQKVANSTTLDNKPFQYHSSDTSSSSAYRLVSVTPIRVAARSTHETAISRLLGLRVRIPPGARMAVSCKCVLLVRVSATGRSFVQGNPSECVWRWPGGGVEFHQVQQ